MSAYPEIIAQTLKITVERARLVEAYLLLQYGTLDRLSRVDIRREYTRGGISSTIDNDVEAAIVLADSYN